MERAFGAMPAVDVCETDGGYEFTAELPAWTKRTSK
jgi:hypothetical protein